VVDQSRFCLKECCEGAREGDVLKGGTFRLSLSWWFMHRVCLEESVIGALVCGNERLWAGCRCFVFEYFQLFVSGVEVGGELIDGFVLGRRKEAFDARQTVINVPSLSGY